MLMISRPRTARGFSLVELMVALAVGLIVISAVLTLVLAIMKSNRQTIQATRLTQELRATAAVIASDLKRARGSADPLVAATATGGNPFKNIDYTTEGCVRYAYADAVGGPFHVIVRPTSGANADRVIMGGATTLPTCASVAAAGTKLGSDQVKITALTFAPATPAIPTADTVRSFNVTITGSLIDADTQLASITRTITQSVYIRSIGAGN